MFTRLLLALAVVLSPTLFAKDVEGILLGLHHDPMDEGQPSRFELTLALPDGTHLPLDPESAALSSIRLEDLMGKRVVAEGLSKGKSGGAWQPTTLLPATTSKTAAVHPTERPWLVLSCHYSDEVPGFTQADIKAVFDHPDYGLRRYFDDVSNGAERLAGLSVRDWKSLPHPQSTYWAMYDYPRRMALMEDCLAVHDDSVDYRQFGGLLLLFANSIGGYAYGGQAPLLLDGEELVRPIAWLPSWGDAPTSASVIAHEMGHAYGLRHNNNADNDGDPYDNGWDIMSSTHHYCDYNEVVGYSARGFATYDRFLLGWLPEAKVQEVALRSIPQRFLVGSRSHQHATELLSITPDPGLPDNKIHVSVRSPANFEDRLFPSAAVYIHTYEPQRFNPLWVMDAGQPMPNEAITDTSIFTPGEHWESEDGKIRIDIESQDGDAFLVKITHQSGEHLFGSGFDD